MPGKYEIGEQPCKEFKPKDGVFPGMGNEHSCFGPWDEARHGKVRCEGTVSYCMNCHRDHHERGYEACPLAKGRGA